MVLGVVLLNVAWNVRSCVMHWSQLAPGHLVVGMLLWLALPLFAVFLLWRARSVGRWILVGLFGLRALAMLLLFVTSGAAASMTHSPGILLTEPCRTWGLDIVFYLAATTWIVASPSIRQLSAKRRG